MSASYEFVRHALKQSLIWDITTEKSTTVRSIDGKIEHKIESTNQLFGVIPDVVGGKTGYTDIALGSMILIVDIPGKNDKIISIILGSKDRFGDTQKLLDWVKTALAEVPIKRINSSETSDPLTFLPIFFKITAKFDIATPLIPTMKTLLA